MLWAELVLQLVLVDPTPLFLAPDRQQEVLWGWDSVMLVPSQQGRLPIQDCLGSLGLSAWGEGQC